MAATLQLDHIVINVQSELDSAETAFKDLGFTLTERGYHTLGSMNALAMFHTDYLELLGFPAGAEEKRPELANAPMGLNGLVFKANNVDETFAHLQDLGLAGDPPKAFSRPVTLAGGETRDAKFRTVTVPPDAFSAGRLYFCEHLTPDLVWRPEWQSHANNAARFDDLTIVSEAADEMANLVARVVGSETQPGADAITVPTAGDFQLLVQTPQAYRIKFGDMAVDPGGRSAAFGAVTVKGNCPPNLDHRYRVNANEADTQVLVTAFESLIVFRN